MKYLRNMKGNIKNNQYCCCEDDYDDNDYDVKNYINQFGLL